MKSTTSLPASAKRTRWDALSTSSFMVEVPDDGVVAASLMLRRATGYALPSEIGWYYRWETVGCWRRRVGVGAARVFVFVSYLVTVLHCSAALVVVIKLKRNFFSESKRKFLDTLGFPICKT